MPGLSVVLGSNQCLPCSSMYIILLLPMAVAGVVLVLLVKILDLTVYNGTMNEFVFYANVVNSNIYRYSTFDFNPLTLFIAWLNLNLGLETCFINGLIAYGKTWLQFVFPLYIWGIAGVLIISARYSDRVAKVLGNNGVPVLATLVLLSYAKLLNTIITVLSYTTLYTTEGQVLVWSADGNLDYLGLKHALLFGVAVAFTIFLWLPYTLLLLFEQWLHKINSRIITHVLIKLKPFLDAHYAVLKGQHRYWFGVLLLSRAAILLSSAIIPEDSDKILAFAIVLCSMVLTFWGHHVYHNTATGTLSTAIFLNLGFLHVTRLFIDTSNNTIIPLILIAIVFTQLLGLIVYKIIAMSRLYNKMKVCCIGNRNRNDDWDDYEQIALNRHMEVDANEDANKDANGDESCESLLTY